MPTRESLLAALRAAVEPLPYVHAMWEGGAASFGRVDQWSDIDVQLVADDERLADTFAAVEAALPAVALRHEEVPPASARTYGQVFYRFQDTSPYLLLDLAVIKHSSPEKFLQAAVHGQPRVHFDKANVVVSPPWDAGAALAALQQRVNTLRTMVPMFQVFVLKELHRGNTLDALGFYTAFTLRPLVEVLRITYCPARHSFHTRYAGYDLPPDVVRRLEPLYFCADTTALAANHQTAQGWFREALDAIQWDDVARRLG